MAKSMELSLCYDFSLVAKFTSLLDLWIKLKNIYSVQIKTFQENFHDTFWHYFNPIIDLFAKVTTFNRILVANKYYFGDEVILLIRHKLQWSLTQSPDTFLTLVNKNSLKTKSQVIQQWNKCMALYYSEAFFKTIYNYSRVSIEQD